MSTISALNSSLQGMDRMQSKMAGHAHRISRFGTENETDPVADRVSLPEEIVGMMTASAGYNANLQVFRIADEMQGSLLDIWA